MKKIKGAKNNTKRHFVAFYGDPATPDGGLTKRRFQSLASGSTAFAVGVGQPQLGYGAVDDCAEAICWLASERSSKTTGHLIPVDGGLVEAFLR